MVGTYNKDEIREKTIRIRKATYDRLRRLGEFGMDFDDVVTKVLDELEGFKQVGEKRPKSKS